jgi:pimeloyl-ACP methyl ester carboxylesterase
MASDRMDPKFETYGVMTTTRDGVGLWWESVGDGPPVLLVPGRGGFDRHLSHAVHGSAPRRRVPGHPVRPPRHGLSRDGGSSYVLADMADDAAAVLAAAQVDAAHLVGISMGGILLVDLCSRRPDLVASLVFVAALSPDPAAGMGEDFFAAICRPDRSDVAGNGRDQPGGPRVGWKAKFLALGNERQPGPRRRRSTRTRRSVWGGRNTRCWAPSACLRSSCTATATACCPWNTLTHLPPASRAPSSS